MRMTTGWISKPWFSGSARARQWQKRGRWLALALAVLLHLLAFRWGSLSLRQPGAIEEHPMQLVQARLLRPPPPPPPPAQPEPVRQPRPAPHRAPRPSSAPPIAVTTAPDANLAVITGDGQPGSTGDNAAPAAAPAAPAAPPAAQYHPAAPPSADLLYDVTALRDGQTYYGSGSMLWRSNGQRYVIEGRARILMFTLLTVSSSGATGSGGLAPELYEEKRLGKPGVETRFRSDPDVVTFAANPSVPRHGDEQDRTSVVWQLSAIGRGDSAQFTPGAQLDMAVAGLRDVASWRFSVLGQETLRLGDQDLDTWHVARLPLPGTYDQRIDIWLAPQREWYPVRIRYTEPNSEFIDMALSRIKPVATQ